MTSSFKDQPIQSIHLSPAHLQPPYHLRHHDLDYAIVPIDLATACIVVEECHETPEEEYHDVREDRKAIGFVRILCDPAINEYMVSILYSPWPAYMPDPYRGISSSTTRKGSTLAEVLQGTHRLFPYYKQEVTCPVPFFGSWIEYRLTAEAIEAIKQEALTQGISSRIKERWNKIDH